MTEQHYCKKCGAPIDQETKFCPYCGQIINEEEDTNEFDEQEQGQEKPLEDTIRYPLILAFIAIGLQSLVMAIVAKVLVKRMSDNNPAKRTASIVSTLAIVFSILSNIIFIFYIWMVYPQIQQAIERIINYGFLLIK